jgi:hypothetical protein
MNTDDFAYGHDLDNEAEHALVPYNDAAIDISRLQTQRLIAPEVVQAVSRRRQELADIHQAQAYRLRQMAGGAMQRFETSSTTAMDRLNEWLYLQDVLAQTPEQEWRFAALTRELLELEGALERQWDAVSAMLREAADHEVSANLLLTRTYQG